MKCSIERIQDGTEEAWILTVPSETVKDLLILLTAYKYDIIKNLSLIDSKSRLSFCLDSTQDKNGSMQPIFISEGRIITSNWTWFDTVVAMLLEVCIRGWAETSHIDYEFQTSQGDVYVIFSVAPPSTL